MSFYAARLTNRLTGKKLPMSISEHHTAFKKLRNTESKPSPYFSPEVESEYSSKDPIQETLSGNNQDNTNWKYVHQRQAKTSKYFKSIIGFSLLLMPVYSQEVRRIKSGHYYTTSNHDPRASTKIASTYQDDLE